MHFDTIKVAKRKEIDMINFTLRIDEETHEKIAKLAEEEQRSLNSQIVYLIKKYIEEKEKNK